MEQEKDFERQISATILALRLRSPFFAALALFARIYITDWIPTAATDGRDIFFNIAFWNKLSKPERLGLVAHEVLHAALLHVLRRGNRDPILWNIAADIVVNGLVLSQKGFELPEGHIRDQKLEHLSVEEIYHILQSKITTITLTVQDLLDHPKDGTFLPHEYEVIAQHWQQALQQAQAIARAAQQGNLPAHMERELAHINPAQLDWRSYLWRFLVRTPTDFQGYDRRFVGRGLYLDTLEGESVRVYVAIDTSGSVNSKVLSQFLSELVGILNAYPHLEARLYYADAACYGPYPLTANAEIPKPKGGGGTNFKPFFDEIEKELEETPSVCIYLTDGYGRFPQNAPSAPVLWVLTPGGLDEKAVPFGETVRLIPD
jgi:predicted metal-dependent peptidase